VSAKQERADPEVDDRGAQDDDEPAGSLAVLGGVVVDRPRQFHGPGIAQHRVLSLRFPGPGRERDEQGLLHGPEACLVLAVWLSHDKHPSSRRETIPVRRE